MRQFDYCAIFVAFLNSGEIGKTLAKCEHARVRYGAGHNEKHQADRSLCPHIDPAKGASNEQRNLHTPTRIHLVRRNRWFTRTNSSRCSRIDYSGGGVKKPVLDQVHQMPLKEAWTIWKFGGIRPNPAYGNADERRETGSANKSDFSAGGWRRFCTGRHRLSPAANYPEISIRGTFCKRAAKKIKSAIPMGCVLTLPATGSRIQRRRGDLP